MLVIGPNKSGSVCQKWLRGSTKYGNLPGVPFEAIRYFGVDDSRPIVGKGRLRFLGVVMCELDRFPCREDLDINLSSRGGGCKRSMTDKSQHAAVRGERGGERGI